MSGEHFVRLSAEYMRCAGICNLVYSLYSRREGKYRNDDTAQSWLRIINENYNLARSLHYIQLGSVPESGVLPGIQFTPGAPQYIGKTS